MSSTSTLTTTHTSTLTKIVYVTRKVQADFLAILDTYGYFDVAYAAKLINDVRMFLDDEVVDRVKFVWTRQGTNYVLAEFDYRVITGGIGLADDHSGGIRYNPLLANAAFTVRVFYNQRWNAMDPQQRDDLRSRLLLSWGPAGQLDYSGGSWIVDRTYSKDGYGLARNRFVRP